MVDERFSYIGKQSDSMTRRLIKFISKRNWKRGKFLEKPSARG